MVEGVGVGLAVVHENELPLLWEQDVSTMRRKTRRHNMSLGRLLIIVTVGVIVIMTGALLLRISYYGTAAAITLFVITVVIITEKISLRSPLIFKYALASALAWLLVMFVGMLNFSFPSSLLILVGLGIILNTVSNLRSGSQKTQQRYIKRIMDGDAVAVIAELKDSETLSAPHLVVLSVAYNWLGDGEQGELFARRALDLPAKVHTADDLCIFALADALATQGRYAEAIDLVSRIENRSNTPAMLSLGNAVWALCAGDEAQARRFLAFVPSVVTRRGVKDSVTPKFEFMFFYLQYRLLGIDRHHDMHNAAASLADWEDEATRHEHNPYGQCLEKILSDIREVMAE